MALLSKEEEMRVADIETTKRIESILSKREELENTNPIIKEYLNRMLNFVGKRQISGELRRKAIIDLLRLISRYCREKSFYEEFGICEEGLILDSMEDICLLDERDIMYKKHLHQIVSVMCMDNFTIDGRNYHFVRDGIGHDFRRLLAIREVQGMKLLLLYSQITHKKKMDKCHAFNSGFSRIYPSGDLVTGNITSPLQNVIIAHSWIETEGRAISPNLNFSQSVEEYYRITSARDMVRIPFVKLENDYQIIMQKNPTMEFYEYLRNPDEIMARLK